MAPPSLLSIQSRLTTTSSLLLERSRVISLNLAPSASSTSQIVRNLTTIKNDLEKLADESDIEASGLSVGGKGKRANGGIKEAVERYDNLVEMLRDSDDMGKERAKGLARKQRPLSPQPQVSVPPSIPRVSIEPPTPAVDAPFRDFPDDDRGEGGSRSSSPPGKTPHELLSEQQMMMDDQDERLNLLSSSIGRQNHLSVQIGDELDIHHELLEDTDAAMDRTQERLHRAKKRLDKVASDARQHGSTLTIVGLIFILLILIIVFKT
ncbi:hypothetical protein BD324DRAFT_647555 [Kockovaella imperatae]|uniref:t-SNARE coiled-coil homology domain-containing protein n=1 Tax=Kockovaella imperatae TaxID=4999 RepID=A0A1Y1UT81_9TREE|nr:hypothetical protein BD324DRAFT_647555 [Kockovaella imperatae]ORX40636.1 hypothetical protein BD324DRAFT_647555 [Kockovaella imperatae]